jgi:hypothetical protein
LNSDEIFAALGTQDKANLHAYFVERLSELRIQNDDSENPLETRASIAETKRMIRFTEPPKPFDKLTKANWG